MSSVYLRREDAARNMARFYVMAVQATLFGEWALVREWGRMGQPGRTLSVPYPSPAEAQAALDRLHQAKVKRGYRRLFA